MDHTEAKEPLLPSFSLGIYLALDLYSFPLCSPSQTRKALWEVVGLVAWPEVSPRAVPFLPAPSPHQCL